MLCFGNQSFGYCAPYLLTRVLLFVLGFLWALAGLLCIALLPHCMWQHLRVQQLLQLPACSWVGRPTLRPGYGLACATCGKLYVVLVTLKMA
jgi:hypothetical protein